MNKFIFILILISIVCGCSAESEYIKNDDYITENEYIEVEQIKETNEEVVEEVPLIVEEDNKIEENVEVSTQALSNKTYAWGFRRMKDGVQPELTASYKKVLDDYYGICIGNKDKQVVYLTFDEGYENGYTGAILDTLAEKDVQAIFFVTMPYVKQNPDLVKRMIDEGHFVGNHIPV